MRQAWSFVTASLLAWALTTSSGAAAELEGLAVEYATVVRPLLARVCSDCHSPELAEAEIDLTAFTDMAAVQTQPQIWQKVGEMLDSGQMPPPDATQPTEDERARLRAWVRRFLKQEAQRNAGDPGPVVLRRLSNAEYTYVLRDLTGVATLAPAAEFPVDGAAGEGFTNTGQALVMSPALVSKYLDAGKAVAAHAILLPNGIRFSSATTPRDWTEEILAEIRQLYALYSDSQGGTQVNLQGIVFDTNGGGRLPIEKYLQATLAEREALASGAKTFSGVAGERGLSPKYLGLLWNLLTENTTSQPDAGRASLLIEALRSQWRSARPEDAATLAAEIARWQRALWQFSSVGHIGKLNGPKAWMEPISPLTARHELRWKAPPVADAQEVVLYLAARDAGDGSEHDFVVWERPRLVAPGRPDLLLKDLRRVTGELARRREGIFTSAAKCLAAASEAQGASGAVDVPALAQRHDVDADVLAAWLDYLGIGTAGPVQLGTPLTRQMTSAAGYDFIQGWVGDEALSVVANSSDQHVRIPGNMPPHSVAVHPSPTLQVAVGWRSPAAATLRITGTVQHAHPECGNGVAWMLELRRGNTRQRLTTGIAHGANQVAVGPVADVAVQAGDFISLVIGPRDGNHSCDLTTVDLTLHDGAQEWNLAREVSPDILAGNPHADVQGHAETWHFYSEPVAGSSGHVIPAGSLLARWQSAANQEEQRQLADALHKLLQGPTAALSKESPDAILYQQLVSLGGPLLSAALHALAAQPEAAANAAETPFGLDSGLFGKHPRGAAIEPASLCVQAPAVLEVRLPADLVAGAEFITVGTLHPDAGGEGSVQLQLLTERPTAVAGLQPTAVTETSNRGPWTSSNRGISHATPVLVADGSAARRRVEAAFEDFRQVFPPALCYTKIVPVDEVVTLTLFYREDEHLQRLMLDDEQTARLHRLWEELHFVSHDALTLVDAFEQLWQYATQDADPKVFEPLRQPIADRAAAFRQTLVEAEPLHVDAVLRLAAEAFRRPLTESETASLKALYRSLRAQELGHDEAIRLLLARVFISPAFLYRTERGAAAKQSPPPASPGLHPAYAHARPVSDTELATRLSFFLWSSLPDEELREAAAQRRLHDDEVLIAQTRRMRQDPRVRRLATEFACQWLHIYDFDAHDEKSETTFPTFAGLRGPMYEESIRFFTDLVQRDGSVLELLDADHTFVNEDLARHYGVPDVSGAEWRRVDGLKQQGRGGILGMASTLSKQAGASRTSPILRGNWISEVLLGEKLPKPPKDVPQLPDVVPAGLTERQLIEQHSSVAACAKCHARIDPLGFALESFDAIGRTRGKTAEGDGQPAIDTTSKLLDGTELDGLDGLRAYLLTARRDDFVRQFCRKLLGYALGRSVQLSDEPLLDEMQSRLAAHDFRISVAIEAIVISPQFRMIRTTDELAQADQRASN